jgi:hypothetical protein
MLLGTLELFAYECARRLLEITSGPSSAFRSPRQGERVTNKLLDAPSGGWIEKAHLFGEFLCDTAH